VGNLPDWIRPVMARLVASAVAAGVAYLARKGIDIGLGEPGQAQLSEGVTSILLGIGLAVYSLVHRAVSAKTNPTDAAAPTIAKAATGPLGAGDRTNLGAALQQMATGELSVADNEDTKAVRYEPLPPFDGKSERVSTPMPTIPLPTQVPNAASDGFKDNYECPFCGGENNYHLAWCKLVGGSGVAPPGFANDTRRINKVHMRKMLAQVERGNASPAVMEAVQQAITEPPPERSRYLKPKVSEAEKVKPRKPKRRR